MPRAPRLLGGAGVPFEKSGALRGGGGVGEGWAFASPLCFKWPRISLDTAFRSLRTGLEAAAGGCNLCSPHRPPRTAEALAGQSVRTAETKSSYRLLSAYSVPGAKLDDS